MRLRPDTRAVLFDLDGTLLDHEAARDAGLLAMIGGGQQLTEAQKLRYVEAWRVGSEHLYQRYLAGELTFEQQRLHRVLRFAEVAGVELNNDAEAWSLFRMYQRGYEQNWRAYSDVAPLISRLNDLSIPFAVVTNGPPEQQSAKVNRLGLGSAPVIASGELGFSKPDPRIFEIACRAVGQPAHACLMIGDNPTADVIGAQEAGLEAILLDRDGQASSEYAHLPTITALHDLFGSPQA